MTWLLKNQLANLQWPSLPHFWRLRAEQFNSIKCHFFLLIKRNFTSPLRSSNTSRKKTTTERRTDETAQSESNHHNAKISNLRLNSNLDFHSVLLMELETPHFEGLQLICRDYTHYDESWKTMRFERLSEVE